MVTTSRSWPLTLLSLAALHVGVQQTLALPSWSYSQTSTQWSTQVCQLTSANDLGSSLSLALSSECAYGDTYGYFFVYFRDENEQVNFALSVGNDPLNYTLIGSGIEPTLTSYVGSKHTRDPYLVRAPDKSKNWIIATDNSLKAINYDFDYAQRYASRRITVYESDGPTLTQWKSARITDNLVPEWSGGVQSPEAYWDDSCDQWMVVFGSNRFADDDPDHKGPIPFSEIYYVHTSDFITFTEPTLYHSILGGGLSDMTIASLGTPGAYIRFFRDDTDKVYSISGQKTTGGLFGDWVNIQKDGKRYVSDDIGSNGGPLIFKDNLDENLWHVWLDAFVGGYKLYETEDVTEYGYHLSNAPSFPTYMKQGSVNSLTCEEYNEIKQAYFS